MPTYQIQKHEVIGRHNKWTQAFGLKPRSFLRADGESPADREAAIDKFLLDTKRCKKNLILVEYPDFGHGCTIIAEVNPKHNVQEIASEIIGGKHSELFTVLQSRQPVTDFREGSESDREIRISAALSQFVYPDEREKLIERK